MKRLWIATLFVSVTAACGADEPVGTPTGPTTTATVAASHVSLVGYVLDTAFRSLPGATVTVADGPHAGLSTTTDADGRFSLAGLFGSATEFRATRDGYLGATQTWRCSAAPCPTNGRPWLGFYLAAVEAPTNIAGDYELTLTADAACTDLPPEVRTRTYAATVSPRSSAYHPAGTLFDVMTPGTPTAFGDIYGITLGVIGRDIGFGLYGDHNPFLVELIAPTTYLAFSGSAPAVSLGPGAVSAITTSFEGTIEYCEMNRPMSSHYECGQSQARAPVHCESTQHRLTLTRR